MRWWIVVAIVLLTGCAVLEKLEKTAWPPSPPTPRKATQAEMEAGTEQESRTVSPLRVAQAISALAGAGSTEVVDADVSAAGDTDTTHAYSKDDLHDFLIQIDTDLDGDVDNIDSTVFATKQDASTAATDTELSTHAASSDHDGRYYTETEIDTHVAKIDETETITVQWDFSINAPTVPTEVYGVGWDGDDGTPTKDAVYDKIETMSGTGNVNDNTAEAITGVWEIQDDTLFNFGNDADFGIRYDETTDDRLEIVSNSATDTEIDISNSGAGKTNVNIDGDLTISGNTNIARSATPQINFGDSDTTDSDDNVRLYSNCTDTGSGTEDCDVTLAVQIAGTLTDVITVDADGNINFPNLTPTIAGAAIQTGTDDDVPESGDFGAGADLEADGSLSNDVVAAAEMADADHGDVSWSSGVASVEAVGADAVGQIADIASAIKSGSDGTLVTGTAGTNTYAAVWNADGDLVGASGAPSIEGAAHTGTTGTFTGTLSGELGVTLDTSATIDLSTASNCRGAMRINSDNDVIDYTLPPAEAGLNCCFYSQHAQVVTIDVDDGVDTITLDGTALTAGYAIDSPGTAGDFICLLAIDATNWLTLGRSGTWVDGGAD